MIDITKQYKEITKSTKQQQERLLSDWNLKLKPLGNGGYLPNGLNWSQNTDFRNVYNILKFRQLTNFYIHL